MTLHRARPKNRPALATGTAHAAVRKTIAIVLQLGWLVKVIILKFLERVQNRKLASLD